jgi:hypothetical protein
VTTEIGVVTHRLDFRKSKDCVDFNKFDDKNLLSRQMLEAGYEKGSVEPPAQANFAVELEVLINNAGNQRLRLPIDLQTAADLVLF